MKTMKVKWIKSSERKPEHLVGVLVFIPEEDDHVTTGMWDISNKWVLLDDYRIPISEVTYWAEMVELPKDRSYIKSRKLNEEDDTQDAIIRNLQERIYLLEQSNNKDLY